MVKTHAQRFFSSHGGILNKIVHGTGLAVFIIGMVTMNFPLALVGAIGQETGHIFQYASTKKAEDSPCHSLKGHLMFGYPVFAALLIWLYFAR
jgi:hypothetical protein